MTLQTLVQFLAELCSEGFTGRIVLDFHKGNLSSKVKKEVAIEID
jgi:hypothetical protein